jgi:hypothetical protein
MYAARDGKCRVTITLTRKHAILGVGIALLAYAGYMWNEQRKADRTEWGRLWPVLRELQDFRAVLDAEAVLEVARDTQRDTRIEIEDLRTEGRTQTPVDAATFQKRMDADLARWKASGEIRKAKEAAFRQYLVEHYGEGRVAAAEARLKRTKGDAQWVCSLCAKGDDLGE